MSDFFFYKKHDLPALTNLSSQCDSCLTGDSGGETYVSKCKVYGESRRKILSRSIDGLLEFYFCSPENVKSTRLFREKARASRAALECASELLDEVSGEIRSQSSLYMHNIVQLNAQSIQAIHAALPSGSFEKSSREELLSTLSESVGDSPQEIAKLIVDLLKNENLEKTELTLHDKLTGRADMQLFRFPVHKVVLLVLNTFWGDFTSKNVIVSLGECYDEVRVDYNFLAMVLVHLFHNAAKYVLPSTTLTIKFEPNGTELHVIFTMLSLKIEAEELPRIFDEGFFGAAPKRLGREGKGIGLWVVRELLRQMDADIEVQANIEPAKRMSKMGFDYEANQFILKLQK